MRSLKRSNRYYQVEWNPCEDCGAPAIPATALFAKGHNVDISRERASTAICQRCASLALCRMAVARHGDLGDRPYSSSYESHERRMQEHEKRIRPILRKLAKLS